MTCANPTNILIISSKAQISQAVNRCVYGHASTRKALSDFVPMDCIAILDGQTNFEEAMKGLNEVRSEVDLA